MKEELQALRDDVRLIRDNHLAHMAQDISDVKERMVAVEVKIGLFEGFLKRWSKWLVPVILVAGIVAEVLASNL